MVSHDDSYAARTAASTPSSGGSTLADGLQSALHDLKCDGSLSHHHADCWGEAQVIARHLKAQGPYQTEAKMSGPIMAVIAERRAQVEKWGDQSRQPDSRWLAILMEEVGEAAQVMLDATSTNDEHGVGVHPDIDRRGVGFAARLGQQRLREEVVQVAAVAVAWLEGLGND